MPNINKENEYLVRTYRTFVEDTININIKTIKKSHQTAKKKSTPRGGKTLPGTWYAAGKKAERGSNPLAEFTAYDGPGTMDQVTSYACMYSEQ